MLLLLGLALLAATGAFVGLLIAYNPSGPDYTVMMFGNSLGTLTSLQIFLAGIALTLVFCLGLWMTVLGAARMRRRRLVQRAETTPMPSEPRRRHRRHIFGH